MIEQGFYIREEIPHPWWVMVLCGVNTDADLDKVYGSILSAGAGREKADNAIKVLSAPNSGYIYSNLERQFSLIAVAHATNYAEMYNTISHEISHLTAHICEWFMFPNTGEKSAYITGEIAKNIYPLVAAAICPKCNCGKTH